MKKILLLSFLILFSIPAFAGVEGDATDQEKSAGQTFMPLALDFGMDDYVFATRTTPISILYEYIPKGQNLKSWNDMATMTMYAPSKQSEEMLSKIIQSTMKALKGNIKNSKVYGSGSKKVGFVEYVIGTGAIQEHNLNMTWLVAPYTVGSFQIQKRGGAPSEETKEKFLELVNKTAKQEQLK